MSLYADYYKERAGKEVLESATGFAVYTFPDAETVYIEELYIIPPERKKGSAAIMAGMICDEAKARGCKRLLGSVSPNARGATDSIKVLLAYGMKLLGADQNLVWFSKEI